jgi:hypothetical protein
MREITHRYRDPLDVVWTEAALRIGLRIERSSECYASTDGRGTLIIGEDESLDDDDCLAQMVFHELCHSLVQGPESFERVDWGLDNVGDDDLAREHACLRVQAALSAPLGLRRILAPTTDHRAFYDALPDDPLKDDVPSVRLARAAAARASRPPWAPHLMNALEATRRIADAVGGEVMADDRSLFRELDPRVAPHPSGLEGALEARGSCGSCAWRTLAGPGRKVDRCIQADGTRVERAWPGCARFEASLECTSCGACCREAYGAVEVSARDPFAARHPELLVKEGRRLQIRRDGDRCAALEGGRSAGERYHCIVYEDRPRTCRDFALGSDNCLVARRRVGLSR